MASVKIINLLTVIIIKFDCFKACIIELYFFFKKDQYFRLIITKEDTRHPPAYKRALGTPSKAKTTCNTACNRAQVASMILDNFSIRQQPT